MLDVLVAIIVFLLIVLLVLTFLCVSVYLSVSVPFMPVLLGSWLIFYAKFGIGLYSFMYISELNWYAWQVHIWLAVVKLRDYWVYTSSAWCHFCHLVNVGSVNFTPSLHFLALLYGSGYRVEAIHVQYGNDFLCFIQVMDYHWLWWGLVSVADGAIRQIYSPIQHIIITSLSLSLSFTCSLSSAYALSHPSPPLPSSLTVI